MRLSLAAAACVAFCSTLHAQVYPKLLGKDRWCLGSVGANEVFTHWSLNHFLVVRVRDPFLQHERGKKDVVILPIIAPFGWGPGRVPAWWIPMKPVVLTTARPTGSWTINSPGLGRKFAVYHLAIDTDTLAVRSSCGAHVTYRYAF